MAILKSSVELIEKLPETIPMLRDYFESVVEVPSNDDTLRIFQVKGVDIPDGDDEIVVVFSYHFGDVSISGWMPVDMYVPGPLPFSSKI